ncbi:MAG: DUF1080 domain-containing protein [Flavihumibacter sp.]
MKTAFISLAAAAMVVTSCAAQKKAEGPNTLSADEAKNGWQLLFDGSTLSSWHSYKGTGGVNTRWKIDDNAIAINTESKDRGDLVSNQDFENYHLTLDWKISPNGNSGIIIDAQDDPAKYEWVWVTGPEIQVLDNNGHPDAKIHKHRASDLYDLIASSSEPVKPVGEWNHVDIIHNHGSLEIKLNGVTTVKTTMWDDNWRNLIAHSKVKDMPDFGKFQSGHIALQDHGNAVWFRNIKIKKL